MKANENLENCKYGNHKINSTEEGHALANSSMVYVFYLYCDPLISGKEVESAALKNTGNQALRGFSNEINCAD